MLDETGAVNPVVWWPCIRRWSSRRRCAESAPGTVGPPPWVSGQSGRGAIGPVPGPRRCGWAVTMWEQPARLRANGFTDKRLLRP